MKQLFALALLRRAVLAGSAFTFIACNDNGAITQIAPAGKINKKPSVIISTSRTFNNRHKVIHVFVALCDNLHQGIEPVPKGIGNGQDSGTNLYWGCDYGVKAFFKKYTGWQLVYTGKKTDAHILERCIFRHLLTGSYMVADAYDGAFIKNTMQDFENAVAGAVTDTLIIKKDTLGIAGNANMVAYVGHEGLMDVSIDSFPAQRDGHRRDIIILACESKQYWSRILQKNGASPVLWTTELMCPEAYTLDAAIAGWLNNETGVQIQLRAATAYSKYQHCSLKAALHLLVSGY